MTQPLPAQPAEVLDVFEGTADLISEMKAATFDAALSLDRLERARDVRQLDRMNTAHIELEKLLGQSRLLSESLGRVIQFHVNRRKA